MAPRKRLKKAIGNSSKKQKTSDPVVSGKDEAARSNDTASSVSYLEMLPDHVLSQILKHIYFSQVVELSQMSRRLYSQITRLEAGFKTWAVHTDKNIPDFVTSSDGDVSISLWDEISNVLLTKLCRQFGDRITSIKTEFNLIRHYPKYVKTKLTRLVSLSIESYRDCDQQSDCIISWIPGVIANSFASLQSMRLECVNLEFFNENITFSALKEIIIINCLTIPDSFFKINAPNLEFLGMVLVKLPQKI